MTLNPLSLIPYPLTLNHSPFTLNPELTLQSNTPNQLLTLNLNLEPYPKGNDVGVLREVDEDGHTIMHWAMLQVGSVLFVSMLLPNPNS